MNNIFKFLSKYSTQPVDVDRLIISSFLIINDINLKHNILLNSYKISKNNKHEYQTLIAFIDIIKHEIECFDFEVLIKLFEFVVSPADRVVNGAVYTPIDIREFIVTETFVSKKEDLSKIKVSDISCGCGGFLFSAVRNLREKTNQNFSEIFKNQIYGLDIQQYSINRTKLLLSLFAVTKGEDIKQFNFNLFLGDALTFKWEQNLPNFIGFDVILGNPPYVCARNLDEAVKLNLKKWEVCRIGNPDLYIPFFQIGIENLADNGVLGFITMNSFFKSLNGRSLRQYFQEKKLMFKVIDFGAEQIFKSKNTYTCICLIQNTPDEYIKYLRNEEVNLNIDENSFEMVAYKTLNSITGWNLMDNVLISKIESTGVPFDKLYKTRHGIATLKNSIYIFKPVREDDKFYYLQNGKEYKIERKICKDIINTNKLSRAIDFKTTLEKVIFPYERKQGKPKIFDELFFKENYPFAYAYLNDKKAELAERDKGKGEYEKWFAFGRTQSLEAMKFKMFFPKMSDRTPSYIINNDKEVMFYNGQAIVGENKTDLLVIKKIMESSLFWYYIKTTSKPYSSNYYSLNGNYIKNFGICNLDEQEKNFVIEENDRELLDAFFERKYGVTIIE